MPLQTGSNLIIAYKKEATFGVLPANDATAKQLRRIKFGIALQKDMIRSAEIRRDVQRAAPRHAMRKVNGPIEGELSLGTYCDFIASAVRRLFTAVSSLSALTNVTAAAAAPHFVRAAGSWITDGLRVGMTVRMTGWTTTATANNSRNYTIIALTATNMTVAEAVVAKAAGDSIVVAIPGKVSYVPLTGHTNESWSFEQWAADASQSRRFLGNRVGGLNFNMPPNDKVGLTVDFVGQDRATNATQYFTAATAAGTTQMQTGLSGSLFINGIAVGILTALSIKQTNNLDTKGVVGSNLTPDVFQKPIDVSGSFSVLWQDATFDGYFDNETPVSVVIQLRDTVSTTSDVMNIVLPATKLAGGSLPDDEGALIQSFDFTAYVGDGTNGCEATTLWVQDTLAP